MSSTSYLTLLGVYGFEAVEPIILAALVTQDPLLLIGKSGTGKTFLLNSLSEALGLEHRHYNASLIAFDELVGFPYPTPDYQNIQYIPTPATIWNAESVLVDELSRCKPEHQNRFFSLIHERRIQGIQIERLRYRWAAMNPCSLDQSGDDIYEGSEPLDHALADRFAFIVQVPDWLELEESDRRAIADPRGEGLVSNDSYALYTAVEKWREEFVALKDNAASALLEYCHTAATLLNRVGVRVSPRRVRQLAKNILALIVVSGAGWQEQAFWLALQWSLPQRAWGVTIKEETLRAAHRAAWEICALSDREKWLHRFHLEKSLARKIKQLLTHRPDRDTGTLAITQLLANESPARAAAFALAVYPLALQGKLPLGNEGITELGKIATPILDIDEPLEWHQLHGTERKLPEAYVRVNQLLVDLPAQRRARATQLFYYFLLKKIDPPNPGELEKEFDECIQILQQQP